MGAARESIPSQTPLAPPATAPDRPREGAGLMGGAGWAGIPARGLGEAVSSSSSPAWGADGPPCSGSPVEWSELLLPAASEGH
eukprot:9109667-Pyramimonas_sp.AAC.1